MLLKYLTICFCCLVTLSLPAEVVRRISVDIGSSEAKWTIADVDTETNSIKEIKHQDFRIVGLRKDLVNSSNNTLSPEAQERLLDTLREMKVIASDHAPQQWSGIATSVFRTANNGQHLLDRIKNELNLHIQLIPQTDEGEVGFVSAAAASGLNPHEIVSWDSGAGSFQISSIVDGKLEIYGAEFAYVPALETFAALRGHKYDSNQTFNPIRLSEIKAFAKAIKAKLPEVPEWLEYTTKKFVAIGGVSIFSIAENVLGSSVYTKKQVWDAIERLSGKNDAELERYVTPPVTPKSILVGLTLLYAVMDHCNIDELTYARTNGSCEGLLVLPKYWE